MRGIGYNYKSLQTKNDSKRSPGKVKDLVVFFPLADEVTKKRTKIIIGVSSVIHYRFRKKKKKIMFSL